MAAALLLQPHPASPPAPVRRFEVSAARGSAGELRLAWRLDADLARLRIPASAAPDRLDNLWHHTCFEAFITPRDEPWYGELNFSPSTAWAAYRFDDYRAGMRSPPLAQAPSASWHRDQDRLQLEVSLLPGLLPVDVQQGALCIGMTAVIEDISSALSMWSLHHPRAQPEFHDRAGFTLQLPAVSSS